MEYIKYKNLDGTYTSPKNGKVYKSKKALIAHLNYRPSESTGFAYANTQKRQCVYCEREYTLANVLRHESSCYMNPANLTKCKVCSGPIKNYKGTKGTCSHSCSNVYFADVRNAPENYTRHRTICFKHYDKKCVVCGEDKIVAVHHYDHNHSNNDLSNLVPLCPTHHQYVHSRYKDEVIGIIDEWRKKNN